ncbi:MULTISPECIES: hypothetical protein [Methylobacterium]|uniref:hypothetical protein n=1 Tax=Methylobacterium TaxID=407 RepID=UPI0008E5A817|nr:MULTISPECIES: hypothetical protein [Methylobacterium]MBZ6412690.1 hypothetical protein [Methylobacterium sp.]MBK3398514.1 hypothetical protein [Methylobacterium ajmalii]MBK3407714.1 hypothetical protein [Methylobacterium ajmalii]MBK3422201.1 hypothetical protein [Methylobacterium ajmalii]SFF27926.1 hypothetical protein SAMN04487844_11392 [Methylobacterium sp. yr596]
MRIVLRPDIESPVPGALCVGTADGQPLSYVGRVPHIGTEPVEHAEIARALADAVDEAASAVFGGEWSTDLARVTALNRRTVTHDRIMKYGLPPWALVLVGRAAADPCPRARGFYLLGNAELIDRGPWSAGTVMVQSAPFRDWHDAESHARRSLERAFSDLDYARKERAKHRVSKDDLSNP